MYGVFLPTRKCFLHLKTPPLPLKCSKFWPQKWYMWPPHILLSSYSWPLSSEGSLTCYTFCDMGQPFIMVIPTDHCWFRRTGEQNHSKIFKKCWCKYKLRQTSASSSSVYVEQNLVLGYKKTGRIQILKYSQWIIHIQENFLFECLHFHSRLLKVKISEASLFPANATWPLSDLLILRDFSSILANISILLV